MSEYIVIRMTISQAEALENAADLERDRQEADGNKREARRYRLASERVTAALRAHVKKKPYTDNHWPDCGIFRGGEHDCEGDFDK